MTNSRVTVGIWAVLLVAAVCCTSATAEDILVGPGEEFTYYSIQEAILASENGDTILVFPEVYQEQLDFLGKAITVKGAEGAAMIDGDGGFGVIFTNDEEPNSVLRNFIITNCTIGIVCSGASPTIEMITLAGNTYGISAWGQAAPQITSCILWENTQYDLVGTEPTAR